MVGLDSAGKTTILYSLKVGEVVATAPTIGLNVETVERGNISFTVWDVGGSVKIRELWNSHFQSASGIIFVVDSNDRERVQDARRELHFIATQSSPDVPLLLFANKQDLPGAMGAREIADKLRLSMLRPRECHIEPTCATIGQGLEAGLAWLAPRCR